MRWLDNKVFSYHWRTVQTWILSIKLVIFSSLRLKCQVWTVRDIHRIETEVLPKTYRALQVMCPQLLNYWHQTYSGCSETVQCDLGTFSKVPLVQAYIQLTKHKALQIKRHKLLIDHGQTYTLLRAWVLCAGRHCQDNINTETEIQRIWHTVLQV